MKRMTVILVSFLATLAAGSAWSYPMDGYEYTDCRRVLYTWRKMHGEVAGPPIPEGARLSIVDVLPRFTDVGPPLALDPDPELSGAIRAALGEDAAEYAVSVLDLSDPDSPVYAELNGDVVRNVGSVGKMVVGLAWFQALADVYPDDVAARERLMRETVITADEFVISDHHKVVLFDPDTNVREFRQIKVGDQGNLWDWMDWMLSASNNAAAATMQKQVMLLKHFGKEYPPTPEQEARFFEETNYNSRGELFMAAMNEPMERNGLDTGKFRQGSFFTREGKNRIPGTSSVSTARELMHYIVLMEQGKLVDPFSSLEIKKLLYLTDARIRYAAQPALDDSAVYFKSGSLYGCKPERGFECKKFHGNRMNFMNSMVVIESIDRGHDVLQAWARFRAPKYGRDDPEADALARQVMERLFPQRLSLGRALWTAAAGTIVIVTSLLLVFLFSGLGLLNVLMSLNQSILNGLRDFAVFGAKFIKAFTLLVRAFSQLTGFVWENMTRLSGLPSAEIQAALLLITVLFTVSVYYGLRRLLPLGGEKS